MRKPHCSASRQYSANGQLCWYTFTFSSATVCGNGRAFFQIEMHHGSLPWRKLGSREDVLRWKKFLTLKELCEDNPTETMELGEAILKVDYYHASPNYVEMRNILVRGRKKASFNPDTSPLDWEVDFRTVEEEDRKRRESRKGKDQENTNPMMTLAMASDFST